MASTLPENVEEYYLQSYWDKRYEKEKHYEWFKSYSDFKHLIAKHVSKTDRILVLGCGNSSMSEDMYNDGFKRVVNIDYSPVVIENMKENCRNLVEMEWHVMDITNLQYSVESFDVVIEKGTLDALMVGIKDPWNPPEEILKKIELVLKQVSRVLKQNGRFISVTFAQPHFRRPLLARSQYDWSVTVETFGESFHYFFYVTKKGEDLSESDKQKEKMEQQKQNIVTTEQTPVQLQELDNENFLFEIYV